MLSMTVQFIIVMIASAINDRMQRKLDYLEEENRILRDQLDAATGGKKLSFTVEQRRRLATAGKLLTPDERRKFCRLVKPATILAWFRQLAARKYDSSDGRRGRRPKSNDVRKLVIKLATENLRWGYTKIRDALRTGLGIEIGRATVANILAEAGIEPAPERERSRTWKQFMKAHWDSLCGCDFFTVEALGLTGAIRYMVFFVIVVKTPSWRRTRLVSMVVSRGLMTEGLSKPASCQRRTAASPTVGVGRNWLVIAIRIRSGRSQ